MAFQFFKKKEAAAGPAGSGGPTAPGAASASGAFVSDPEKAKRFFDHARAVFDSTNYEYSMTLWLQGLRQDPTNMEGLEAFFKACAAFLNANPKSKGPTKEQAKNFTGKGPLEKYLLALLTWGTRPGEWTLGIKALDAAVELEVSEPAYYIGDIVLRRAMQDPKAKKDHFVTLMDLFSRFGAFDKAVLAGDAAVKLDPTDQRLANEVKNTSAQATITSGGYEATGQAGGFRQNVRDIAGQRAREEDERVVKSEDAFTRVIERARADYELRPTDPAAIDKYGRALRERGTPEDEKAAYTVYMKGFEDTKIYKLREAAGDLRIRVGQRKLRERREAAEKSPGDAALAAEVAKMDRQMLEFETQEFRERVAAYPTDLTKKYELGSRLIRLEKYDEAIEQLQLAQGAPGLQSTVLNMLGMCFCKMGWMDEAEGTFRRALESHSNPNDDLGLLLRYGLMDALEQKARDSRDLAAAEEAFKLASGIAIQQIGFRDIRARREGLQSIVKELRQR